MAVGSQATGEVISTVFEFCVVSAWLGEAVEAVDLTTDSVDTVSIALGNFLHGCITLLPGALREAGTPKRGKRCSEKGAGCPEHVQLAGVGILRRQTDPRLI